MSTATLVNALLYHPGQLGLSRVVAQDRPATASSALSSRPTSRKLRTSQRIIEDEDEDEDEDVYQSTPVQRER